MVVLDLISVAYVYSKALGYFCLRIEKKLKSAVFIHYYYGSLSNVL